MCHADAVYLPDDQDKRVCRTVDRRRGGQSDQCCPVKFGNRGFLSVVSVLSAGDGTFIQTGLSPGDLIGGHFHHESAGDCRKSVPVSERGGPMSDLKVLFHISAGKRKKVEFLCANVPETHCFVPVS